MRGKSGSLNLVNESAILYLRDCMPRSEGWGRPEGREVYPALLNFVEAHPGTKIFRVSLERVQRMDMSFVSETIVQLAKRYRGNKGFCFIDMPNEDMAENIDAAAMKGEQPFLVWRNTKPSLLGPQPGPGTVDPFNFALQRPYTRVADFVAANRDVSLTNASNKFKQLWQQGYLLRRERAAETGGVEYVYYRIG
jgi:hypothetical protein